MIAANDNESSVPKPEPKPGRGRGGGPKTPEGKAKALANLKPPWQPGCEGGPGRPAAGLSIREWLNQMQEWPVADLLLVMADNTAPAAKRAAARCWIDAAMQAYTSSGAPVAGSDFDRICDRTEGKPDQRLTVTGETKHLHTFDFERYDRLYRGISRGNAKAAPANGNGKSVHTD